MREAKESELQTIKGSWTWRMLNRLQNWKYRFGWSTHGGAGFQPAHATGRMPAPPNSILCLPIIEWDFRFQRPQQLMLQFAKHGYRVFYVSTKAKTTTEKAPNVFEVPLSEIPNADVIIVQHPKWASLTRQLGGRVIYDCMDHIAGFTTESRNDDERQLMASADLVIVTSAVLEREARKHAKNVVVIRNGCDYEHFAKTPRAGGPRKVVGYYGAISDWFDVPLVAQLARRRPEWDFLIIGSTYGADILPFGELPNVTLPGEKPYAELPEWLGVMDVCIIPFKRIPLTEATNPVKVYEMLAAGKPVVSVPIPEVAALAPLVRLASDAAEFEREIEEALRADDDAEARRAFAREQTWEKRFEELLPILLP
ncbi:MAG TPA: glycosyltransferase [Thermoanaerobaculia bacterium]|jgi:glycosyltransferase involved in cell wall biosynthesis|nr:glycosyltransferase [Thermoanaerobaculia bacterium]